MKLDEECDYSSSVLEGTTRTQLVRHVQSDVCVVLRGSVVLLHHICFNILVLQYSQKA